MDMQMTDRVPDWLTPISWVVVALAVASATAIATDIYLRRHRQASVAVEVVWISAALYLGPFAVLAYRRHARTTATTSPAHAARPVTRSNGAVAGLPGGGASAIAHLIGVPLVIASGLTIAGIQLWVMILVIGALAVLLLAVYERNASAERRTSVGAALAVATLTVLAFDLGMGGWMLLLHFNELMPPATDAAFWFLMQLGIVLGLLTGYPVVRWLAARRQGVSPA